MSTAGSEKGEGNEGTEYRRSEEVALPSLADARRVTNMPSVEEPTMRSVALTGLYSRSAEAFEVEKGPFGISRPSLSLKRGDIPKKTNVGGGLLGEGDSIGRCKSRGVVGGRDKGQGGGYGASNWQVDASSLELLPEDFPLERTSRVVDSCDASVVASRISETLRLLSIEAQFDGKRAKAKCQSQDLVKFRVQLFSCRDDNSSSLVVEIQRRCGSSLSFMNYCRAILDAAEGKEATEVSSLSRPLNRLQVAELSCLKQVRAAEFSQAKERQREEEITDALDEAAKLLRKESCDVNILGMQALNDLTNPLKSSPYTALQVSRHIIGGESFGFGSAITSLLQFGTLMVGSKSFEEGHDGGPDPNEQLRTLALSVLSNALLVTSKDGCLVHAVQEHSWILDSVVPVLIDDVKNAKSYPNDACAALRCLSCLASTSEAARKRVLELKAFPAFIEAREYGKGNHVMLATESEHGIDILMSTW